MVKVRALHALSHDALRLARGEEGEMSEVTAADLESKGLVAIVNDKDSKKEAVAKMDAPLSNKMAAAPANKAAAKKGRK